MSYYNITNLQIFNEISLYIQDRYKYRYRVTRCLHSQLFFVPKYNDLSFNSNSKHSLLL